MRLAPDEAPGFCNSVRTISRWLSTRAPGPETVGGRGRSSFPLGATIFAQPLVRSALFPFRKRVERVHARLVEP